MTEFNLSVEREKIRKELIKYAYLGDGIADAIMRLVEAQDRQFIKRLFQELEDYDDVNKMLFLRIKRLAGDKLCE